MMLITLFISAGISSVYAQDDGKRRITGTVSDENGQPLPGAYVYIKDTQVGTTANLDGMYVIDIDPSDELTFSFIGWCIVAGGAVFPIAYAIRAHKDGIHGKVLTITACILQFFFVADVISVMVLTLKEKRWRKLTLTVIILLAIFAVACILGLAAFILSIAVS